jgi:NAD dependent epimerase/dehydratase family enzyme
VNAVAPAAVTNRDYTAALARVLERPAFLHAPAFVLKRLPGGLGELFLHSQRVDPAVLRMRGFRWDFPDLETALRDALGRPLVPAGGPA